MSNDFDNSKVLKIGVIGGRHKITKKVFRNNIDIKKLVQLYPMPNDLLKERSEKHV